MFEKNFEKKVESIGKAFTKAISDYDALAAEAKEYVEDLDKQIVDLQNKVIDVDAVMSKAATRSTKLKEIFGE